LKFPDNRDHRIFLFRDGEDYFVLRVIQTAKASEILVGFPVDVANRLDDAYRRREGTIDGAQPARPPKKIENATKRQEIVGQGSDGHNEK
jgi:hypothetical protein